MVDQEGALRVVDQEGALRVVDQEGALRVVEEVEANPITIFVSFIEIYI